LAEAFAHDTAKEIFSKLKTEQGKKLIYDFYKHRAEINRNKEDFTEEAYILIRRTSILPETGSECRNYLFNSGGEYLYADDLKTSAVYFQALTKLDENTK
jgi:hypothetical protein